MESGGKDDANKDATVSASAEAIPPTATVEESKDSSTTEEESETSEKNPDHDASSSMPVSEAASQKLQEISSKALHKSKDLLSAMDKQQHSESHSSANSTTPPTMNEDSNTYDPSLSYNFLKTDPAIKPVEVVGSEQQPAPPAKKSSQGGRGGVKGATKEFVATVFHPRRAVIHHYRSRTAKNLATASRPYTSPTSDRDHALAMTDPNTRSREKRRRAAEEESATSPSQEVTNSNSNSSSEQQGGIISSRGRRRINNLADMQMQKKSDVFERQKLELRRQGLAAAWITGRHIKRVRLVPSNVVEYPRLDDEKFMEKKKEKDDDSSDIVVRFKWERYIAQVRRGKKSSTPISLNYLLF